ncbi:MAG: hypothetical protein M1165_02265 [Candidatus Pacearchaeota archaeon]|nr:hypothetical protein [Candidatus Pacearchaeota archaeon]
MVELKAEVKIETKPKVRTFTKEVNPVGGVPNLTYFLEEELSQKEHPDHLPQDFYDEYESGWRRMSEWTYILGSEESLHDKMNEILEQRRREGWKVDPQFKSDLETWKDYPNTLWSREINAVKLVNNVGPHPLTLEYSFYRKNIVR